MGYCSHPFASMIPNEIATSVWGLIKEGTCVSSSLVLTWSTRVEVDAKGGFAWY